jgi:hypothetical protein
MIITERFVVLNNPKTGSTFVRTVLKQLHSGDDVRPGGLRLLEGYLRKPVPSLTELLLPNIKVPAPRPPDQHGTYSQIPAAYRKREVVSVVRDPFARLLSTYRFGWWRRYPPLDGAALALHFPGFPDLDFEEYLRLEEYDVRWRVPPAAAGLAVGLQTVQFIQMFFRDPAGVLARLDDHYLDSDRFLADLPPVRFLRTERLNEDLVQFLLEHGYPAERLRFVAAHAAVNATVGGAAPAWTHGVVENILHRERLLFRILAHLGFTYPAPCSTPGRMPRLAPDHGVGLPGEGDT